MEFIQGLWEFLVNLLVETGPTLDKLVTDYNLWVYAILFAIIFCETGLVVTPFLPGDSLLFLAGTIAHRDTNDLNILVLIVILIVAAVLGDAANYHIGHSFGKRLFRNPDSKIFKQSYLEKTNQFYAKHGGKTIIIARFVPIVRTFAPFVAGMGKMTYHHFFSFNIIGGIIWVAVFCLLGYCVGGLEIIQNNLQIVAGIIILISIMPAIYEVLKAKLAPKKTE